MLAANERPEAPTAIRIDLRAIFISLELSRSKWLITSLSPGGAAHIEGSGKCLPDISVPT
jgi:transposase